MKKSYSEKFFNSLYKDELFIKNIEDIKFKEGHVSYNIFIDDEDGSLEKEDFIMNLEYYEGYREIEFNFKNQNYFIIFYYGTD